MYRTCTKCGWKFPYSYTKKKCRFCRSYLDTLYCKKCKQNKKLEEFSSGYCKPCASRSVIEHQKRNPEKTRKRKNEAYAKYKQMENEKMNKLLQVKAKTMTEEEWLKICEYFGGCAICEDPHIEVRSFFIPFEEGGKYTAWNMLPLCGKCSASIPRYKNPFIWLNRFMGRYYKWGLTRERRDKIIEYLKRRLGDEGSSI